MKEAYQIFSVLKVIAIHGVVKTAMLTCHFVSVKDDLILYRYEILDTINIYMFGFSSNSSGRYPRVFHSMCVLNIHEVETYGSYRFVLQSILMTIFAGNF
jgi:hypothetical protein